MDERGNWLIEGVGLRALLLNADEHAEDAEGHGAARRGFESGGAHVFEDLFKRIERVDAFGEVAVRVRTVLHETLADRGQNAVEIESKERREEREFRRREFKNRDDPAFATYPRHLLDPFRRIDHVAQPERDRDRVEPLVVKGERAAVRLDEFDRRDLLPRKFEHLRDEVDADGSKLANAELIREFAPRPLARFLRDHVARARGDVERLEAFRNLASLREPREDRPNESPPPPLRESEGQKVVEKIVFRRDFAEHRLDASRRLVDRRFSSAHKTAPFMSLSF